MVKPSVKLVLADFGDGADLVALLGELAGMEGEADRPGCFRGQMERHFGGIGGPAGGKIEAAAVPSASSCC